MKRIITLLAAIIFAVSGAAAGAAEPSDRALRDVKALGIMQGDQNGDMMLDKTLTRAEFATVILNMLGVGDVAASYSGTSSFEDVDGGAWYAKAVNYIVNMKIMNGYSETQFAPEDSVTLDQAVKTIVVILGYQDVAIDKGGYPDGYNAAGASLGLLKNVAVGEEGFVRGDLVTLIYNALDVNRLIATGTGVETGSTLRDELTGRGTDIIRGTGIVSANYEYYTSEAVPNMKADEVLIDGVIYKIGNTNANDCLGMEVDYYSQENEMGERVLTLAEPTRNNSVFTLNSEDFEEFSDNTVTYNDGSRRQTLRLENDCVIVKNGSIITVKDDSVFDDIDNGVMKFIDNTGNSRADIIIADDYKSAVAEQVRGNMIYFERNAAYNGKRYLEADPEGDIKYIITDKDGNYIDISGIGEDSLLSISESSDGGSFRIVVSGDKAEGVLNSVSDDTVVIDGSEFHLGGSIGEASVGDTVKAYIDFKGSVAYMDITEQLTSDYGYIAKAWEDEGGIPYIMVIKGGQITESEEVDNQNEEEEAVPIMICQNEGLVTYELDINAKLDGKSIGGDISALVGQVAEIYTNSENIVTRLNTMEIYGGGVNVGMRFDVDNRTFSGGGTAGSFAIDTNTKVICVPSSSSPSKDDYMVQIKLDSTDSTRKYIAQGYKYNSSTKRVELMVVTEDMNASSVSNVNIDTCKIGFVKEAYEYVDSDGEIRRGFTVVSKTGEKDYETVDIIDANSTLAEMGRGDLIFFNESNTGKLENAVIMQRITYAMSPFYNRRPGVDELRQKGYYTICGTVEDIEFDEINEETGMMADAVMLNVDGTDHTVYINQVSAPAVFLYEGMGYSVEYSGSEEIYPGDDMMYAIITADGTVRAAVIIR